MLLVGCSSTTAIATTTIMNSNTRMSTFEMKRFHDRMCTGENLTHIVVREGVPTSFPRLNNGQPVQWQVSPSSSTFNARKNITNYDDVVRDEFANTYVVNQSQLIIFNSTVAPQESMNYSTAGLYTLRYQNPNCTTAANLIVISKHDKIIA